MGNHVDVMRVLLEHGADANAADMNRNTPLLMTAYNNCLEGFILLFPNVIDIDAKDSVDCSALDYARMKKNIRDD